MTDEPGVRVGIANGTLVAALLVAAVARLTYGETAVMTVTVAGLACAGLSTLLCAATGVVAWAMFTGFVENAYGQLTFASGDVERLAVFVVAALAVAGLAQRAHLAPRRPRVSDVFSS